MGTTHFNLFVDAQSGSGKTYLVSALLQELARKTEKAIVVLDVKGEYAIPGFYIVRLTRSNYREILRNFPKLLFKYKRIIVRYDDPNNPRNSIDIDSLPEIGNFFSMIAMHYRNVILVFEEAELYAPKGKVPKYTKMVATMGRTYGVDSIWIAQRHQQLDTNIRTQSNFQLIGRMVDTRDKDIVRPFIGKLADFLDRMPRGHFLFKDDTGKVYITSTLGWKVPHNG